MPAVALIAGDRCTPIDRLAVNSKDGSVMVRISSGEFEMGDDHDRSCPNHRVHLDEYWIGLYTVTNRQYVHFVRETGHRAPHTSDLRDAPAVWRAGRCPDDFLDHPVVCVSWSDAASYATWAGLKLPTEAQWERAARGPHGLAYPWGAGWGPAFCQHSNSRERGQTVAAWEYPRGVSREGTYQQSGNVWEWCFDSYETTYYRSGPRLNPTGPPASPQRVARGSCWCGTLPTHFRAANRYSFYAENRYNFLGFRVVRDGS